MRTTATYVIKGTTYSMLIFYKGQLFTFTFVCSTGQLEILQPVKSHKNYCIVPLVRSLCK